MSEMTEEERTLIGKVISSPTRWKIFQLVKERELCETEIAEIIEQTQANVSAQIKIIEKAGLIESYYTPGEHGVKRICKAKKGVTLIL